MSTGGVFQLISNDGRMDQLLLANSVLRDNINAIKSRRAAAGEADTNPTLADLERSHVLFVNAHSKPYVAIAFQYFKVSANNVTFGSQAQVSVPQYGDFFSDMVANVVIKTPVCTLANSGSALPADVPLYRYCDYPGERIFDEVSFEVNSNPIDKYTSNSYVLHRQFHVPQDKLLAWKRCMGQETPRSATPQWAAQTGAPVGKRLLQSVYNGFQTYRDATAPQDLVLWVPLLFWFNQDVRLAFPSVSVPYGQRFIKFNVTTFDNLFRAIVNPASESTTTAAAPSVPVPQISTFDLYINNLFVIPEVHDIFIDRVAFTLVRVHLQAEQSLNKDADRILLQQLKWPIETIVFGFQPKVNRAHNTTLKTLGADTALTHAAHSGDMESWHVFGKVTAEASTAVQGAAGEGLFITSVDAHVTTLKLTAHSVDLFSQFPARFFNAYIPYKFGGSAIVAPTDPGLYMYSFSLFPGQHQPSGHFNTSRSRELYLDYSSTYIASDATAQFFLEARAINFLLITEGSCSLRLIILSSRKQGASMSQGIRSNALVSLHEDVRLPSPYPLGLAF